ncbi:hypothetical protein [Sphingomonas morindae]|uniref:Secreted protein n=1 Tax=Sphingomonas morindae TaxID=1541170 RepID=A0ABY4X796_9SPHN|nr:hypothetical protein [Sphingomonas morindae]USI72792.1 hypothetical protein LHA26_16210 [Sphingomonas morindae]
MKRVALLVPLLLMAAVPVAAQPAPSCAAALAPGAQSLPEACRRIGPVALGMSAAAVQTALGAPDYRSADGGAAAYLFPRHLDAALARRPVKAAALRHSELVIAYRQGKVAGMALTAGTGLVPDFAARGFGIGTPLAAMIRAYGPPRRWNGSHDEASYDPLPLSFMVDDEAHRVFGVTIGQSRAAAESVPQVALALRKAPGSDLVSGVTVKGGD